MKQYRITLDDRTFDVRVLSDPRQAEVEVEVDGQAFTVAVETASPPALADDGAADAGPVSAPPATARAADAGPGEPTTAGAAANAVTAPLPGVIKSIAVRPGQQVAPGETLLVIEAMKMDNLIRASRAGVVRVLHVAEGHRVAHGQLMLEYQA